MQITILRHGIPDLSGWGKINSSRMPEWIEAYNSAGVKNETCQYSFEKVRELTHKFIVCSNLTRSTHSAKIIGYQSPHLIDAIFCEAELPKFSIPVIRLTPHVWSMIFRVFWFAGVSTKAESLEAFKLRVSLAAEKLIQLAKNHDSVLFIGHGIINRFLAKELISEGWSGEEAPNGKKYWGYKYWEYAVYIKT
ncbi:MAG: histidine phosphatase family protein [Methylococcaceae bacterium]